MKLARKPRQKRTETDEKFREGIDYYYDGGLMVLTEKFLLQRGYCCGSGCRHCPYPSVGEENRDVSADGSRDRE